MDIRIGTHEFRTKDSWNALDNSEVLVAYAILKQDDVTPVIRLSELTKMLLNVGDPFLHEWQAWYENQDAENGKAMWAEDWTKVVAAVTTPFIDNIEKSGKGIKYQISLSFTKCPFPKLSLPTKRGNRTLLACADGLKNMTIGEFARLDNYVQKYERTSEEKHIIECVGMIFREHKEKTRHNVKTNYQGDKRVPLTEGVFTEGHRGHIIATSMTEGAKKILWFWIVSCREQMVKKWQAVFNPGSSVKKSVWDAELAKFGWAGLFIELAGNSVMTEADVEQLNCEEVFVKLAYLETKRKAEKAANS